MRVTVENPTSRTKAVRAAGGLRSIPPGGIITVEVEWSDAERARYEAAGLVAMSADDAVAHAEPEPVKRTRGRPKRPAVAETENGG